MLFTLAKCTPRAFLSLRDHACNAIVLHCMWTLCSIAAETATNVLAFPAHQVSPVCSCEKNPATFPAPLHTQAVVLEMIGDLPEADVKPPANVLFICKLNPVTTEVRMGSKLTAVSHCAFKVTLLAFL